ncbi:MAG: muramoyltetrapeptide carboxypeptidase [Flavobacteriales bacterium]|jgi:muramoyltetrapeptide carboxypeptidase
MNCIPSVLSVGDVVTLVAPSRFTTEDQVQAVTRLIEAEGFRVDVPDGLLNQDGQFGGEDRHRAKLIQTAWDKPGRGAVLPMRGGYGAGRLLPLLNFKSAASPKWMCGFSDITALHAHLNNAGVASFHSPVGSTLVNATKASQDQFFAQLKGEERKLLSASSEINEGACQGELMGGNLSVLFSLNGTPYFPNLKGKILFLEDLDEMRYHLDRMLLNFKLAGVFDEVAGVLIGQISEMRDNTMEFGFSNDNPFGKTTFEICKHYCQNLKVPVSMGFASGHEKENLTLPFGQHVKMTVTEFDTNLAF